MEEWVSFKCWNCLTPLKLKAQYAHLRGRCPLCSVRIEPIRPHAGRDTGPLAEGSAESGELLPIDDEWPEPARVDEPDASGYYKLADEPEQPTAPAASAPTSEPPTPEPGPVSSGQPTDESPETPLPLVPDKSDGDATSAPPPNPLAETDADEPKTGILMTAEGQEEEDQFEPVDILGEPAIHDAQASAFVPKKEAAEAAESSPVTHEMTPQNRASTQAEGETIPLADALPPLPTPAPIADTVTPYRVDGPIPVPSEEKEPSAVPTPEGSKAPLARFAPSPEPDHGPYRLAEAEPSPSEPVAKPANVPTARIAPPKAQLAPEPSQAPYQLSEAERAPKRPPPAPAHPFWTGVTGFPIQPSSLVAFFLIAFGLTLLGGQATLIDYLVSRGGALATFAAVFVLLGTVIVATLVGVYAIRIFLCILQDTAAGNDEVDYGEADWKDSFGQLVRFVWLVGLAVAVPAYILSWIIPGTYVVVMLATIFPVFLLSALAADSWFPIVRGEVVQGLMQQPTAAFAMFAYTLGLFGICVVLARAMVDHLWLVPIFGAFGSYSWLVIARVLGRVGYIIASQKRRPGRTRKRKRPPRKQPTEDPISDPAE